MSMGDASSRRSPKDISHLQTFLYCRLQLTMIGFLVLLSLLVVGTCLAETLSTGEDVTAFVRSMIDDHDVMVFAKSYCPHCKRTKALLFEMQQSIDVDVEFIDLDLLAGSDGPLIQKELQQVSGQRTVPNIFIAHEHVGGNSELQQLSAEGELETILLEASSSKEL